MSRSFSRRAMRRYALFLTLILVALAGRTEQRRRETAKLEEDLHIKGKVSAWLNCEECVGDEFRSVVLLGRLAVPRLGYVLLKGAPTQDVEQYKDQLDREYDKIVEYASRNPDVEMPYSKEEYRTIFTNNLIAAQQIRASKALTEIGGIEARKILEKALTLTLRQDVRSRVAIDLEKLKK